MSPALTDAPNDGVCQSCETQLDGRGLRCTKCTKYTHVSCSELPDYQLVRYALSNIQYCCIRCCKTETGEDIYNQEITQIHELKEKEDQIVKNVDDNTTESPEEEENSSKKEQNKSRPGKDSDKSEANDNSGSNSQNGVPSSTTKKPNCRYYLRNSCKHGRKGATCKFDHPKLCFKFIEKGDKRGGCNKGTNCDFVHPKLCNSYKSGVCRRPNCSFYHTKSTKISRDEIASTHSTPRSDQISTVSQGDRGRQPDVAPMRILQRPQHPRERSSDADMRQDNLLGQTDQRDFLEMKAQMKSIQETLQLLLVGRIPPVETDRAIPRTAIWGQR